MTIEDGIVEFLMVYGWGILIVLVAIGGLAYFGVFDGIKSAIKSDCPYMGNISKENISCINPLNNLTYSEEKEICRYWID